MAFNSIVRMINTKAKTEKENREKTEKHLKYIMRKDATNPDLCWANMLDIENVFEDFGFFAKCSGKNNGRPLKHIVVSYAVDDEHPRLDWQEYLAVTREISKFYGSDYQMVAAVHDNIKNRPHAHIIMDCYNVSTKKKFSEGVKELEKFKDFIDDILEKHKIPKLLRQKNKMVAITKSDNMQYVSFNNSLREKTYHDEEADYVNKIPYYMSTRTNILNDYTVDDEIKHFLTIDEKFKSITNCLDVDVFEELTAFFMKEPKNEDIILNFKKLVEE